MGVTWSKSRLISNDTKIVVDCDFPRDRTLQQKFWALWREHKDALKNDGFSIKKNEAAECWRIAYWHTVNDVSHVKDETTGKPQWRMDMERKLERWIRVLETIEVEQDRFARARRQAVPVKPAAVEESTAQFIEESVLDAAVSQSDSLDFDLSLNEEGEVVSTSILVKSVPAKPIPKTLPPVAAKVPNRPVRVDINKLLDDDEEY